VGICSKGSRVVNGRVSFKGSIASGILKKFTFSSLAVGKTRAASRTRLRAQVQGRDVESVHAAAVTALLADRSR